MPDVKPVEQHYLTADGCITRAIGIIKQRGFPDDVNDKAKNGVLAELGKAKKALVRLRDAASVTT
jgi:hypothetical protein